MVRESKIKELTNDKVVALLSSELTKYGFKYQKSKRFFSRQDPKGFSHIIYVSTPYSPLVYNDNTEELFLVFNLSAQIEIPDYIKWTFDTFGQNTYFSFRTESLTSQIKLSFDDFDIESFYEPTASQQFKRRVTLSFMGGNNNHKDIIPINDFLETNISSFVSNLTDKSDILKIYKSFDYPFQNINLLVFGGHTDLANEQFEKYYQFLIDEIESKLKISETEASSSIGALNWLIKNVEKVSNLTFTNPFKRSVKVLYSKNEKFVFSQKTHFIEKLRLDISQFEIKAFIINQLCEVLLFTANQKLIKINSNGELVFEKEIEIKKGFESLSHIWAFGVIEGTNDFFLNNYIITTENEILELNLPIQKLKKGKLQNSVIADFAYWHKNEKYLIIYEDNFLVYSKNGKLESSLNIGEKYGSKIIIKQEWIITQKRDTSNVILNFDGKVIGTYEFGNGNRHFEFSSNYEFLICFSYSTKSQFYNLSNGNKDTLWAHPTFIKNYKEQMYNDIEHNFGMEIAKFSPDNKYIVGGAYHGKYVAWKLPKLERFELMPSDEMIELLEPLKTSWWSNNESGERITKVEKVILGGQTFLKNRRNGMSKIMFFEDGDIFITELGYGKFVLSWDRNFNNLTYYKIDGKLELHSQKYLTQKTNTELIIYEQN